MDVESRQVFFKSFDTPVEQELILRLSDSWLCFDDISRQLGVKRVQAERWIDALTLRCLLAEKEIGKLIHFKILNDKDFEEEGLRKNVTSSA